MTDIKKAMKVKLSFKQYSKEIEWDLPFLPRTSDRLDERLLFEKEELMNDELISGSLRVQYVFYNISEIGSIIPVVYLIDTESADGEASTMIGDMWLFDFKSVFFPNNKQ